MSEDNITVKPESPKSKIGRPRKYNTPEEVHQAKLEQMRQWRLKRKQEKAETEFSPRRETEAVKNTQFKLTLEFDTDEERQQFIKSHSLKVQSAATAVSD